MDKESRQGEEQRKHTKLCESERVGGEWWKLIHSNQPYINGWAKPEQWQCKSFSECVCSSTEKRQPLKAAQMNGINVNAISLHFAINLSCLEVAHNWFGYNILPCIRLPNMHPLLQTLCLRKCVTFVVTWEKTKSNVLIEYAQNQRNPYNIRLEKIVCQIKNILQFNFPFVWRTRLHGAERGRKKGKNT